MAITSYPFENADTTEGQYSALFRELQDTGVVGSFGDASLRVTGDSTGMQVKAAAGSAFVRGFFLSSTAVETIQIQPATAQPRIDRVVARLNPATDSITLAVLPGTPAATSPAPPALTQTDTGIWDMPLARVTVRAGTATISAADVADERPWIGHRAGLWTTGGRPTSPRQGRLGLNMDSGRWEYWWGTTWVELAPDPAWSTITGVPAALTAVQAAGIPSIRAIGTTGTTAAAGNHSHAALEQIVASLQNAIASTQSYHVRVTGVSVGLGGTTRTFSLPSGRFTSPPVVQVSAGDQTQATNLVAVACGAVTKDSVEVTIRNNGTGAQTCTVHLSAFMEG